jgi:hypothetical protein
MDTGTTFSYTLKQGWFGRYYTAFGKAPEGKPMVFDFYKNGKFITTYKSTGSEPFIGLSEPTNVFKSIPKKLNVVSGTSSKAYQTEVNLYTQKLIKLTDSKMVVKGKGVITTLGERYAEANRPFIKLTAEKPQFDVYRRLSDATKKIDMTVKTPKIYFVEHVPKAKVDFVNYNKEFFSLTKNPTFMTKQITDTKVFIKGEIYNPTRIDSIRLGLSNVKSASSNIYGKAIKGVYDSETIFTAIVKGKVSQAKYSYQFALDKAKVGQWKVQNLFSSKTEPPINVEGRTLYSPTKFQQRVKLETYGKITEFSAKDKEASEYFNQFGSEEFNFYGKSSRLVYPKVEVSPKVEPTSKPEFLTKTLAIPIVKTAPFSFQVDMPKFSTVSSSKLSIIPIIISKPVQELEAKTFSKSFQSFQPISSSIIYTKSFIGLKPMLDETPTLISESRASLITTSTVTTAVITPVVTPIVPVITPVVAVPSPLIKIPPPLIPKTDPTIVKRVTPLRVPSKKGFVVLIKRRGKFVPLAGVYAKEEALSLGAFKVARTLAATFKVVPSVKRVSKRFSPIYFSKYRGLLRDYKIRKGSKSTNS